MQNILIPDWPAPQNIKAYTTTRLNGFSEQPYHHFNLGNHVGDNEDHVARNRALLNDILKLPAEPLWLNQVHGTQIFKQNYYDKIPTADGSFTSSHNIVCAILTADCLPILLCDQSGTQVAAVHAGWRGLAAGVIESAIDNFKSASNILAWLGPAIGPSVYEVGDDVRDQFLTINGESQKAFTPFKESKWLADVNLLARQRLTKCGVHNVYGGNYCTFSDKERFFSFRRDKQTGRMASLIWISD